MHVGEVSVCQCACACEPMGVGEDKKEMLTISLQLLVCSTQFSLGVEVGDYVCFTLTLGLGEIFRYLCSN